MGTIEQLIADLRGFSGRKEIVKALRKEMRKPVPVIRKQIKARALVEMPRRGGLNVWVSKTKVTAQVKINSRTINVKLTGSRKSATAESDLRRLDAGRIRHPSWGRRGKGQWHPQSVPPGFFTRPVEGTDAWRQACIDAANEALEVIRRG